MTNDTISLKLTTRLEVNRLANLCPQNNKGPTQVSLLPIIYSVVGPKNSVAYHSETFDGSIS